MTYSDFSAQEIPALDLKKLQSGDIFTFRSFYHYYHSNFIRQAQEFVPDEEARTIVVHCFIKCWIASDDITSIKYALGYLNSAIRFYCTGSEQPLPRISAHQTTILQAILFPKFEVDDTQAPLSAAINWATPVSQEILRLVFGLYYVREYTLDQIAGELEQSRDTIQSLLSAAKQMLHLVFQSEFL